MKKNLFTYMLISSAVLAVCVVAYAASTAESTQPLKIHVFEDCKKVDEVTLSQSQIAAYEKLQSTERKMKILEAPLKKMEQALKKQELALDNLSGEMVIENDSQFVVNKTLIKQHEEIAAKMEAIVHKHSDDIEALEKHARTVEQTAHEFETEIKPVLSKYDGERVHISIGEDNTSWRCSV